MERKDSSKSLHLAVAKALRLAADWSYNCMKEDGHWCGEVLCDATFTAEYIFLLQAVGHDFKSDADSPALRHWLLSQQNPDGSWGLAPDYPGDASSTVEVYLALKMLEVPVTDTAMTRAKSFALDAGGIASVRIFTRILLATFGLFPWDAVPQLPPELILLPKYSLINVYNLSYWARTTCIPLLLVRHHEPVYALPGGGGADYLDELWIDRSQKEVPYSPSLWDSLWKLDAITFAFTACDKALSFLGGLRSFPLRGYARQQCIDWILQHQETEGDWAGAMPPMQMGILALLQEGYDLKHPAIQRGLEGIERYTLKDSGGKRIQSTVSPVWDTVLMTVGLCDADVADKRLERTMQWVKNRQLLGQNGDWRVYNPNLSPGGWSFQYYNTWYPDTDDTAAAMLALIKQDPYCVGSFAIYRAAQWNMGMQNRDGGWGAFDKENNKSFLNKLPFADIKNLCDPSTADVTGRLLECFALLLYSPHTKTISTDLIMRMKASVKRGIGYLEINQEAAGAWYGRWGCNYVYGTSSVLCGLSKYMDDKRVKPMVDRAVKWLKSVQNADGGWGERFESYRDPELAGRGPSTASQTAWALMALLAYLSPNDPSIHKGVSYLVSLQEEMGGVGASWPQRWYTGVGFPLFVWMEYKMYRHYFPMMALGRYLRASRDLALKEKLETKQERVNDCAPLGA